MSDEREEPLSDAVPQGGSGDPSAEETSDDTTVLELFGIELKVRNPRLAEVLKMDAKDALSSDMKNLMDGTAIRERAAEASEAVPDVVLTPGTSRERIEAKERTEMRQRVSALGAALGFDVQPNGTWLSPSGIGVLTRLIEHDITPAAAADFVMKVDALRPELLGILSSALYVAEDKDSAAVMCAAITERGLYDHARAIALDDLEFIQSLHVSQALDHKGVLVLLTPVADADVGDLLSIIRAAAG